ncbi:MAG: phosphotransferase [Bdellovibrionales bacterium]|nr:phosphotransferase [Bdellovibrionales bacterium]
MTPPRDDSSKKTDLLSFVRRTLNTDEFELLPLAGDASNRIYHRVVSEEDSWVLMEWEPFIDDDNYPFLSVLSHFRNHKIHVPKVIGKAPQLGLVLLEDLGDLTLERKFWESQDPNDSFPYYQQAIDEVVKIHGVASQDIQSSCTAFRISFDTEKLLWEMNYGRKHLLEGFCQIKLNETESKALDRIFMNICHQLDAEPKVICHRDYHSRNVMLKLGKMRVIDFQDARMGPVQYDLVSLIHDSYVKIPEVLGKKILNDYLDKSTLSRSTSFSQDHFNEVMNLQIIQRCFKACGSFSSFYNMRQDTRYLKYIAPTIRKVAKHLERQNEFLDFYHILNDHGVLEHDYEPPCMP